MVASLNSENWMCLLFIRFVVCKSEGTFTSSFSFFSNSHTSADRYYYSYIFLFSYVRYSMPNVVTKWLNFFFHLLYWHQQFGNAFCLVLKPFPVLKVLFQMYLKVLVWEVHTCISMFHLLLSYLGNGLIWDHDPCSYRYSWKIHVVSQRSQ